MGDWRGVEMVLLWIWACSPHDWALIFLVSGPSPLGLMLDVILLSCLLLFLVESPVIDLAIFGNFIKFSNITNLPA